MGLALRLARLAQLVPGRRFQGTSVEMSRRAGRVIGDRVVGQDSVTGRPAAMSVASWCSFADDSRTPKGVSELRSRR